MLFRNVDRSDWLKTHAAAQEQLARLDRGLAAVKEAAAKLDAAGIKTPDAPPEQSDEEVAASRDENDGAMLEHMAAAVLQGLGTVDVLRKEVAVLDNRGADLSIELHNALAAEKRAFDRNVRIALRIGAGVVVVILFRACVAAVSR